MEETQPLENMDLPVSPPDRVRELADKQSTATSGSENIDGGSALTKKDFPLNSTNHARTFWVISIAHSLLFRSGPMGHGHPLPGSDSRKRGFIQSLSSTDLNMQESQRSEKVLEESGGVTCCLPDGED